MRINLYKNVSENNTFTRNFTAEISLDGVLKDETDVLHPIIMVETDNISKYNYLYIPEFGRYYFCSTENVRNKLWRIRAIDVDVLYTYKSDILKLRCIIDKQQNKYDEYINDGSYINEVKTFTEVATFTGGFNDNPEFILITAGAISGDD